MERMAQTLDDLDRLAIDLVGTLTPGPAATLVTLSGELGAGKTAFTKAVAKALGVGEVVNSPTFVLEKIYQLPEGAKFERLIHIDAYRLESGAELAPLALDALMQDPANLILLEWPEKVVDALPASTAGLRFEVLADGARKITYG